MQATRRGRSLAAEGADRGHGLPVKSDTDGFLPPIIRADADSACSKPVRARHTIESLRIERDATMSRFHNLKPNADAISLSA